MTAVRAAIVGGTGYGGMELLRYLLGHPGAAVTAITSRTESGAVGDVHPHLRGLTDLRFTAERAVDLARGADVLFFATPGGVAAKEAPDVLRASSGVRVIDLSADFRLAALRAAPATVPGVTLAYGMPECGAREEVRRARLVANPGCHASAAVLALWPLARAGLLDGTTPTVVSVTGSSGAGATPAQGTHHPERFANFRAYKPLDHHHLPEIEAALGTLSGKPAPRVSFVPCSGPFSRGIGSTTVVDLAPGRRAAGEPEDEALRARVGEAYGSAYGREPFVRMVPEPAEVRAVAGTNWADVSWTVRRGALCVTVALDNLGKGMAGTAVQNMNVAFGLPEEQGLRAVGAGL